MTMLLHLHPPPLPPPPTPNHPSSPHFSLSTTPHSFPFPSVLFLPRNPRHVPSNPRKPHLQAPSPLPPTARTRVSSMTSGAEGIFDLDHEASMGTTGEDLGPEGEVFRRTLRLVECAMLASVSGLTYILSNSLAIENYFGCFFSLPIVISSMRWGLAAGRKTTVATAMLLLTLSGPVKATTYLVLYLVL